MKVILSAPYAEARGVFSQHSEYYIRMLNGKPVVQRRPVRTKPPTEKQLRARQLFAERYASRHDVA